MIFLDFETRSRIDITETGAWRYAEDPSTDVLCLAYAINDGPVDLWVPGEEIPKDLRYYIEYGFKVEAHNAFFERAIWRNIMVPRYGWLDIPDAQWACSAAKAAYHALPRELAGVGAALNLPIQKNLDGKKVMLKLSKPRKPTKADPSEWCEDRDDYRTLYRYCRQDVESERCVNARLRDLPPTELAVWDLDQKINERGIRVDMDAVRAALKIISEYTARQCAEFFSITGIDSPTKIDQFKEWLQGQGVKMDSLDKNSVLTVLGLIQKSPEKAKYARAKRALEIRQELAKSSTAKYQKIADGVCRDGRLRDFLMYHGASTGRWTGKLVQPQNFPKITFEGDFETYFQILKTGDLETFELCYPDVMATLSATIRGVFIPSEGEVFFGGDYNAIEARVLFWLAGEEAGLKMFRDGADIYKDLAVTIYEVPFTAITKPQRDLGKSGILGCGFGMGKDKFKLTCKEKARIDISEELAARVIHAYRSKYAKVVKLWSDQETAAKQAIETKKPILCGKVLWGVHDGFLFCRLPSGRCLAYYDAKIEMVTAPWGDRVPAITFMEDHPKYGWVRGSTYGGKLTENITQAVARDLMATAMLRVEEHGYKVNLTVHDELLTCKPAVDHMNQVSEFEQLMGVLPAWAEGIPVKAEGWSGKRYKK